MREVKASSWKYDSSDGSALDKTPSSDSSLTVAGENSRVVLSSVFASYSFEYKNGTPAFTGTSFTDYPRVYFRDATSSPSTVFAIPCSNSTVAREDGLFSSSWGYGPGVVIPGPGVLFGNGLSLSVQAPAADTADQMFSVTVNILYQV